MNTTTECKCSIVNEYVCGKHSIKQDTKKTVLFIKNCLRDEGYSRELIAYLFSTYDLDTFINESNKNKLELASGFLSHARVISQAASNY